MYDFSGKIAVVTGAAQGLGEAIAKRFLNDGIPGVALLDLNEEVLAATAARLDPEGNRVMPVACDVSDPDSVAQAFQAVERRFGTVDILVNNAGISAREPLADYTPEAFRRIMDLNVTAVFHGCKAVEPVMRAAGHGCIINTSSMVSLYGQPSGVGYPTSKFAVNGLTRSLARELGPAGIRVNAVAPGVTRTDMVAALPPELVERISAPIPLRRIGEAEEVANVFLFLASELASYVTGAVISVDGAAQT